MQDRTLPFDGTTPALLSDSGLARCMQAGLLRVALHFLRPGEDVAS